MRDACLISVMSLEFNVGVSTDDHAVLNSSVPVDCLMSSSWTAGLVCVTAFFQWPQCECTLCLCVCLVCLDWNWRMCNRCVLGNVRPCLFGLFVALSACSCALWTLGVFYSILTALGDTTSQLSSTSLPFLPVMATLSRRGVRWRGDNNTLSPMWLMSISHVKLWLWGRCS